ncbi:Aminotransferase, class IV [Ophiocordyceps camponoti-floridani]|uniref:Aminotransferase, class IV n=1 Tax=Ophiocordyceps camponoti-floridani TaxID=2030778 RepID=A0A8H4QCM4_9HYPO|nr:Aminotransferase, class IV [Ophiocordyceps camponoti-floridani]
MNHFDVDGPSSFSISSKSMADPPFSLLTSLRYDLNLERIFSSVPGQTSWNYDRPSSLYMLDFHRDRLLRAAKHWGWIEATEKLSGHKGLYELERLALEAIGAHESNPKRLRILVTREADISFQIFDTPAQPLENLYPRRLIPPGQIPGADEPRLTTPCFKLVVDGGATRRSEFTHFKTTRRAVYDSARQRAGICPGDLKEVLILSADDRCVMEGSITTPYFWRKERWVTPPFLRASSRQGGSGGHDGTSRRWALERGLAVEEAISVESLVGGEECWLSNGVSGFQRAIVCLDEDGWMTHAGFTTST